MSLGHSISTQARIVYSVAAREAQIRHRTSPLGVLTALIEPLALICIMTVALSAIRLRVPGMGDYVFLFLVTGILPLSVFRQAAGGGEQAFMKGRRVLAIPQLRPLDFLAGGALLSMTTLVILFAGIAAFFRLVYDTEEPENFLLALLPLLLNGLMGFGLGCINLTIKSWFPFWGVIFSMAMLPLNISSGIFYTAESLPQKVQDILYWNPFMHSTELCRTFFFPEYESDFFDPYYYGGWVLGVLTVGLLCERIFRYRLIVAKN